MVEFEVECLKEWTTAQTQAVSISSKIKSKMKLDDKINKKEDHPKFGKSKSDRGPGPSETKKKARHGKKPSNGGKAKSQCHKCGEPDRFARGFTNSKNVSYCNSTVFVCSHSLMVSFDSLLEWV